MKHKIFFLKYDSFFVYASLLLIKVLNHEECDATGDAM